MSRAGGMRKSGKKRNALTFYMCLWINVLADDVSHAG